MHTEESPHHDSTPRVWARVMTMASRAIAAAAVCAALVPGAALASATRVHPSGRPCGRMVVHSESLSLKPELCR